MKTLEIVHLRLAWKAPDELVTKIQDTLGRSQVGMEFRVYRHARFAGDIRVHLYRDQGEGGDGASALGEQLASTLRKHGMVDHSLWVEATDGTQG
jgi:hypothetical protein